MKVILVLSLLALAGCGNFKRMVSGWTGSPYEYCHKGVEYIQFPSGASVSYNQDGSVIKCN